MRKHIVFYTVLMLIAVMVADAQALEVPQKQGYVTDLADMMSPRTRQAIAELLAELEKTDSVQIAILTIPSLEKESIQDFSTSVSKAWKADPKGNDKSAILIVSHAGHIHIEVGNGLEDSLTNRLTAQIINNVINPQFMKGSFDAGFVQGASAIAQTVRGESMAPTKESSQLSQRSTLWLIISLIVFIVLTERFIRRRRRNSLTKEAKLHGRPHGSCIGSTISSLFFLSTFGGGLSHSDEYDGGREFNGGTAGGNWETERKI